jgi:hypothetical protein
MNANKIFVYHGHNLPAVAGVLVGSVFLILVFKVKTFTMKLALFLIAAACFAAAYWWKNHIRS